MQHQYTEIEIFAKYQSTLDRDAKLHVRMKKGLPQWKGVMLDKLVVLKVNCYKFLRLID